jgi:hypothetical protein
VAVDRSGNAFVSGLRGRVGGSATTPPARARRPAR